MRVPLAICAVLAPALILVGFFAYQQFGIKPETVQLTTSLLEPLSEETIEQLEYLDSWTGDWQNAKPIKGGELVEVDATGWVTPTTSIAFRKVGDVWQYRYMRLDSRHYITPKAATPNSIDEPRIELPLDDRPYVLPALQDDGVPLPPVPGTEHYEEVPDELDLSPENEWTTGWEEVGMERANGKITWQYVDPKANISNGEGVAFRRVNGKWQYRRFGVLKKA